MTDNTEQAAREYLMEQVLDFIEHSAGSLTNEEIDAIRATLAKAKKTDPDLLLARRVVADEYAKIGSSSLETNTRIGNRDSSDPVRFALAAIKQVRNLTADA